MFVHRAGRRLPVERPFGGQPFVFWVQGGIIFQGGLKNKSRGVWWFFTSFSTYYSQDGGTVVVDPALSFTVEGDFYQTGGILRQTRPINNAMVVFLQIMDSGGSVVKYRGVEIDTTMETDTRESARLS